MTEESETRADFSHQIQEYWENQAASEVFKLKMSAEFHSDVAKFYFGGYEVA